jgi:ABC-2 type transport system permease protein
MWGGGILTLAYVLRMAADSSSSLSWLRWLTPLGWIEELRPLTGSHPLAFAPAAGATLVLGAVSVALAGSLDLGGSVLRNRTTARARLRWLSGPTGLAARLGFPVAVAWTVAVASMALVLGLVAGTAGASITGGSGGSRVLEQLGVTGGGAAAYLGLSFIVIAIMLAFVAAGQIGHARDEEATGRLDHVVAGPVHRVAWLGGRLALAVLLVALDGIVAGLVAWAGAASQGTGVGIGALFAAGVNVIGPALAVLGVGALLFGAVPRLAPMLTYGFLGWSLVIDLLAGFVHLDRWVLDTSVFRHIAAAPAGPVRWGPVVALVLVGAAAAAIGVFLFVRRDLRPE